MKSYCPAFISWVVLFYLFLNQARKAKAWTALSPVSKKLSLIKKGHNRAPFLLVEL
jgi:hypothetical protein